MPLDLRSRGKASAPYCLYHGLACAMGTRPLPEITEMVIRAKQRFGYPAPPLDEHRLATPGERRRAEREVAAAIAQVRTHNDRQLTELRNDMTDPTPEETQ
ncbi:hypothetical protein BX265_2340 [Streptomyces sp. TLI_235]|nr:hypothetical protein [Streptomyces sp. TLI_235]PBC77589.1 hypothetical protein BX265_2340 [Streptomyces sp. TLI_235]